ncbi:DUF4393 domain-containing protein [Wukongibacter sp. M2B1]|uniref:DUF4393 domain-containing protein n=1 Tax=Wukongibacter sp. M2B1 TaxID=3088895 RepID=UPI003D7A1482
MSNSFDTKELIFEAAKTVAKEGYDDALKPFAKELGKTLDTAGKTVNALLFPLRNMVYKVSLIEEKLEKDLEEKLINVPAEKRITPPPYIAVPALEAMRYTFGNIELRNLFTNLLASSMNTDTVAYVHPSFIEIVKQLSPLDAKIFKEFEPTSQSKKSHPICKLKFEEQTKTENLGLIKVGESFTVYSHLVNLKNISASPDFVSSCLQNLERLGLIEISYTHYSSNSDDYKAFDTHPVFEEAREVYKPYKEQERYKNHELRLEKGLIHITSFGRMFASTCIE